MEALSHFAFDELCRAIIAFSGNFVPFRGGIEVEQLECRSWASVTFTGERLKLRVALEGVGAGEAADRFLELLPEAEFDLRGHIVADIFCTAQERGEDKAALTLEALTVEDC